MGSQIQGGAMTTQLPGCLPPGADLNSFLTVKEWAIWTRIAPSTAEKRARDLRRRGVIPRKGVPKIHVKTYLSDLGSKFKEANK